MPLWSQYNVANKADATGKSILSEIINQPLSTYIKTCAQIDWWLSVVF